MSLFAPVGEALGESGGGGGGGDATLANQQAILADLETIAQRLSTANVEVVGPVANAGLIVVVRGDDYKAADGRSLDFSSTGWPDLAGATIKFSAQNTDTLTTDISDASGSVVTPTGAAVVRVELSRTQTALLAPGAKQYAFDVRATLANTDVVTLVEGQLTVLLAYST